MRRLILVLAPFFLLAPPARAESWKAVDELMSYDADSAGYDAEDDVAVVFVADRGGTPPPPEPDRYWMAISCGRAVLWIEDRENTSWSAAIDIPAEVLADATNVAFLRGTLCERKAELPPYDFQGPLQ